MTEALLRLDELSAGYGQAVVLDRLTLSLSAGESLALLGRNGAGKTTLLKTLMGLTQHHGGSFFWCGADMRGWRTSSRAQAGVGWVPQERLVFPSLSVEENLTVAARPGPWTLARVYARLPRLGQRRASPGSQLSGGEQQMLAIARALMTNPCLLLLDEPMEGLAPLIVRQVQEILADIIADGLAVILVEQHARLALGLTQRAVVLERGKFVFEGASAELLEAPDRLAGLLAAGQVPAR